MSTDFDDEIFQLFLEESQEHLEDIETDLLEMEEQGDNVDDDLVNKVFRAVHTVKGGSGFFGLTKVQELAHIMENLLGMVRNKELAVTHELISILLDGADVLKRMIDYPEDIDNIDISSNLKVLNGYIEKPESNDDTGSDIASSDTSSDNAKETSEEAKQLDDINSDNIDIRLDDDTLLFSPSKEELRKAQKADNGGQFVYLVVYDLKKDIEDNGRTPQDVVKEFDQLTYFIDSKVDFSDIGSLGESIEEEITMPFYILCATVMDPEIMSEFVLIPKDRFKTIIKNIIPLDEEPKVEQPKAIEKPKEVKAIEQPKIEQPKAIEKPKEVKAVEKPSIPVTKKSAPKEKKSVKKSAGGGSVRIPVEQLEKLMNLAGELVLTRNELLQKVQVVDNSEIHEASQRVNSITSELQEAIMVTRMQSIDIVFNKFKRVVRDLSGSLDKKIDLVIKGEDVELDRTIIEAIGDPLTHMVRNSVDHGIETPEKRLANGKSDTGTLKLTALHDAGQVVIRIEDDGAGIDPEIIGSVAVKKGVITQEELDSLPRKEIIKLIFKPGFSTAEKVTDVSGRGVGMDVVMSSLSKVGGIVDIDSVVGKGSTISIKLPLTLAIIPSLLLQTGSERFAIPQVNLVELVRVRAEKVKEQIDWIGNSAVLKLREKLLPLVKLSEVLGMENKVVIHPKTGEVVVDKRNNIADRRSTELEDRDTPIRKGGRRKTANSALSIAVVSTGDMTYGLIVDSLLDSEEIVVKPLGLHLKECKHYSGATILGDGHVAMILDITAIKENSVMHNVHKQIEDHKDQLANKESVIDTYSYLLFNNSDDEQLAIPMDMIARIEKVKAVDFEVVGSRRAMKYRGDTLIILSIDEVAAVQPLPEQDTYNVIVFQAGGVELGIVVGKVSDIVEFSGEIDGKSYIQAGIMGSAIISEKITMIVDIYDIAKMLVPDIVGDITAETQENINEDSAKRILIVEDSLFFLRQIDSFIKEAGYETLTAENGQEGIEVLKQNEIDLILTDIEMPIMNGLDMVKNIRLESEYKDLPIIAVTSVSGPDAEAKGKEVGINEYLIKMDKEQILQNCLNYLS